MEAKKPGIWERFTRREGGKLGHENWKGQTGGGSAGWRDGRLWRRREPAGNGSNGGEKVIVEEAEVSGDKSGSCRRVKASRTTVRVDEFAVGCATAMAFFQTFGGPNDLDRGSCDPMRFLLYLLPLLLLGSASAAEPFLKPNDVIALVGGEDMVVASELGYLETMVQQAVPGYKLKFRGLAWEGDTVFEQRRDLNYPTLDSQLEKIGATVVIAQFGQMESLGGSDAIPQFQAAYDKLVSRLRGPKNRRVALLLPTPFDARKGDSPLNDNVLREYAAVIEPLQREDMLLVDPWQWFRQGASGAMDRLRSLQTRDGVHLTDPAQLIAAEAIAAALLGQESGDGVAVRRAPPRELKNAVVEKNRLWSHYTRPQNWAFLAGDRTNQPSSRDHKDMSKRWFPGELEEFVPLIEAKENTIWGLAAKLKP